MFMIFLLLPIKSLLRISCVCKAWHKLIHSAEYVEAYNTQAQTTPILIRGFGNELPRMFHVETRLNQLESFSMFSSANFKLSTTKSIHFLEIEDAQGKITESNICCSGIVVASCNGLVLIKSMYDRFSTLIGGCKKAGQLIIMNPMTRKLVGLPLGTLPHGRSHNINRSISNESYGLVFVPLENTYKVVHLFQDKSEFIACEIFCLSSRSWKTVDGLSEGLLRKLNQVPISAIGALHWIPDVSGSYYIVSMTVDHENFSVTELPKPLGTYDRLVEIGGFLTFVTRLDKGHIEVWILKGLEREEWVKQHTIHIDAILGHAENEEFLVPAFALNAKEMVFRRERRLYSYDFELEEMKEIEVGDGSILANEYLLPHTNNLATWEPLEPMR